MRCPRCNSEIHTQDRFCARCGNMIQWCGNNVNQGGNRNTYGMNGCMNPQQNFMPLQRPNNYQNWQKPGYNSQNGYRYGGNNSQKKNKNIVEMVLVIVGVLFVLGMIIVIGGGQESEAVSKEAQEISAENIRGTKKNKKKKLEENEKEQKQQGKSCETILGEYANGGYSTAELDASVLYQYGVYYKGYAVHTAFVINEKDADLLKMDLEDDGSWFYSLICKFDNEEEIEGLEDGTQVEVVGVVEEPSSIGKTVTLTQCQVISSGETAQKVMDNLAQSKETQLNDAEALKISAEEVAVEKEKQDNEAYKASCVSVDYNDVARNPDNYNGQNIVVTGVVIQVSEGLFDSVTLRVDIGDGNIWYVNYYREKNESRILENDTVTLYGECTGVESYTSVLGGTITIPSMDAKIVE